MTWKTWLIVLAVLGFVGAEWYTARKYQRNIDLASPAETVKVQLPPIRVVMPPETLRVAIHVPIPKPPSNVKPEGIIDSLGGVIVSLSDGRVVCFGAE